MTQEKITTLYIGLFKKNSYQYITPRPNSFPVTDGQGLYFLIAKGSETVLSEQLMFSKTIPCGFANAQVTSVEW